MTKAKDADEKPVRQDLYFYVLMRTDMDSMNYGKGCAQSAHAQKHADMEIWRRETFGKKVKALYEEWERQTEQGFGVTITKEIDGTLLPQVVEFAKKAGFAAAVTHDPTYPLLDGKVLHLLPVDTCGWVFGPKDELAPLLRQFGLCP
jgi:hypothetical protein